MIVRTADFVISNTDISKCPSDGKPEYAFIGRSNVGKSSLINMLAGQRIAMTSQIPGKTLLINHFIINNEWYLVDLPGYGYAKRDKATLKKINQIIKSYIAGRMELTNLFVLVDIRLEPQKLDLELIEWLGQNGVPFSIVFTKADKLSKTKANSNVEAFMTKLAEQWEELPKHFISSSENKTGKEEILNYIEEINKTLKTQKQ